MRNGQKQEHVRANQTSAEEAAAFEELAIERPAAAHDANPAHESTLDHLSGTSFSFAVDRPATPARPAPQQSQDIAARLDRFPDLEAGPSPRQLRQLTKEQLKTQSAQAKKARLATATRSPRGASSLLDRYVSFIARFMKMFEKFLLKLLRRQPDESGPPTERAKTERDREEQAELQPQKPKRRIVQRGPRL